VKRIQLFEIHDAAWLPSSLRDCITDYLQFSVEYFGIYKVTFPRVRQALKKTEHSELIDLCSGGGGPLLSLQKSLESECIGVTLTDKFPNLDAFENLKRLSKGVIGYESGSVDCINSLESRSRFYSMYTAFHHLSPKEGKRLLENICSTSSSIAVFEAPNRSIRSFLLLFPLIAFMFAAIPWIKPFRWSRIFWTYLIPLAPLIAFFDGVISNLRSYSPEELAALIPTESESNYHWSIGYDRGSWGTVVTYCIGIP